MSKENNSVEQKMVRLKALVAWFENDNFVLDEASAKFEEAAALSREIENDLSKLKNTVTVLKQSFEEK